MGISLLLEMAADGFGDRPAYGSISDGVTYAQLLRRAQGFADLLRSRQAGRVVFLGTNSVALPVTLFAAALAGKPFVPLNYRLTGEQLAALLRRSAPALLVADADMRDRLPTVPGIELVAEGDAPPMGGVTQPAAEDDIAVLLFTSGTTGEPKAAVLRHEHMESYIFGTVDFMSAEEDECSLISVPPYHIAAISNVLSSLYAGRRIVQLKAFDPEAWVATASREAVTHAMVVPTMLERILGALARTGERLPALRHLAYGGGRMPLATVKRAMGLLPEVAFVNAYGLTETSSTIALLTPEDHREAYASEVPAVQARLASVGRPLPSIELEIRDEQGRPVPAGVMGELFVRGPQVSGEYLGRAGGTAGWFATRDSGYQDAEGYLFLDGRLDDVIVRGGENVSPGEIEAVLLTHPGVADAAVVAIPHAEWGEGIAAVVVRNEEAAVSGEELADWIAHRLRSSRKPDLVVFREALPYSEIGKLLRRVLKAELSKTGRDGAITGG